METLSPRCWQIYVNKQISHTVARQHQINSDNKKGERRSKRKVVADHIPSANVNGHGLSPRSVNNNPPLRDTKGIDTLLASISLDDGCCHIKTPISHKFSRPWILPCSLGACCHLESCATGEKKDIWFECSVWNTRGPGGLFLIKG